MFQLELYNIFHQNGTLNSNIQALLINSGNANAGTGQKGLENAYKTCEILAQKLKIQPEQILPFSTGVIGEELPLEPFENSISSPY